MRNRKIYLWLLYFIMVFSLYLTDVSVAMAAPDAEVVEKTVSQNTVSEDTEYDTVSTADEFTKWLDSHRNNGGRMRLTKDIVLREFYFFSPAAADRPDIFVDTDSYTITAAGKITFLSDGHLIFQGKAGNRGILRAAKGSLLTLDGVIVEDNAQISDSYAVWQEEGAGIVVGKTYVESRITGDIHYADIPFVTQTDSICVVVEKGQSVDGLLPDRIKCRVNRQGRIEDNVQIPVSWDFTGTERQQEKRLRFQIRGTSSEAVFDVPPVCTVVYNDYPLTFTTVNAFIQANAYYFQGGYTKPEKELPIAVAAEYSFDGDNWITGNEENVSDINAGFSIYFPCDQWDSDKYPSVYIRLRGDKDGKEFLSNVLRYEANNMGEAEDIGGSVSIVNPPDKPSEDSSEVSSGDKQPSNDRKPSDKDSGKHDNGNRDTDIAGDSQSADEDASADAAGSGTNRQNVLQAPAPEADLLNNQPIAEPIVDPADGYEDGSIVSSTNPTGSTNSRTGKNKDSQMEGNSISFVGKMEAVQTETMDVMSQKLAAPAQDGTDGDSGTHQAMTVTQKINMTQNIVLVLGFVTLSAGIGVVAYFVHAGRTRRRRRRRSASSKTNNRRKGKIEN